MRLRNLIGAVFVLAMAVSAAGCGWPAISGRVVDDVTGQPIEGAVVMAHWTRTKGMGLTITKTYAVNETVTDANGEFRVKGVFRPLLNHPQIAIYKKGYICWFSFSIFPERHRRTHWKENFPWKSGQTYRLEPFKEEYTYTEHTSFIRHAFGFEGPLMREAWDWERYESVKERHGGSRR